MPEECLARGRQPHVAPRAGEERGTDLELELLDGLTNGRLSDSKPSSGATEVQFLGERLKHANVAELDHL